MKLNGRNSGGISVCFTLRRYGGRIATAASDANGVSAMPMGVTNVMNGAACAPVSSLEIR